MVIYPKAVYLIKNCKTVGRIHRLRPEGKITVCTINTLWSVSYIPNITDIWIKLYLATELSSLCPLWSCHNVLTCPQGSLHVGSLSILLNLPLSWLLGMFTAAILTSPYKFSLIADSESTVHVVHGYTLQSDSNVHLHVHYIYSEQYFQNICSAYIYKLQLTYILNRFSIQMRK